MSPQALSAFIVSVILTVVILIVFIKPVMHISKFILRGALYSILIFLANFVTGTFGFTVGVNLITSAVCGFLGIYGIALNYIIRIMYF